VDLRTLFLLAALLVLAPVSACLGQPDAPVDVVTLLKQLNSPSFEVRAQAKNALIEMDADARAPILSAMQGVNANRRSETLRRLGGLGVAALPAVPALVELLPDPPDPEKANLHHWTRAGVARALGAIGDGRALEVLIEVLRTDPHQVVRAAAARAFAWWQVTPVAWEKRHEKRGQASPPPPAALPALTAALADRSRDVRISACSSLAKYGADAQGAVPELRRLLDDPDDKVAAAAQQALDAIAPAAP